MKIALIHASDLGHGAEQCVMRLHEGLRELGHDSRLYVGTKRGRGDYIYEISRPRPFRGFYGLRNWLEKLTGLQYVYSPGFRKIYKQLGEPDIVHVHTVWARSGFADIGAMSLLAKRYPVIMTMHDQWLTTGHCACPFECIRWRDGCGQCPDLSLIPGVERDATRWNWRRKQRAMQQTDAHITTVSAWLKNVAMQSPILAGHGISVVHNGIDTSVFQPGDKLSARNRFKLPIDRPIALLAGQTVEGVNVGIAQQWVAAINGLSDGGRLLPLLVGHSAQKAGQELQRPFITLPFQKDSLELAKCYQAADFTIVTSEYETFGRIAAESQACGTPVIAFATGGLPEVVQHEVGGLLVPSGDIHKLGSAIKQMINNPEKIIQMGNGGHGWVEKNFSNSTITQEYLEVYAAEVGRRSKGK